MCVWPIFQKAEKALAFYKNAKNRNDAEKSNFETEFERLKALATVQKIEEKIQLKDICEFFSPKNVIFGVHIDIGLDNGHTFYLLQSIERL